MELAELLAKQKQLADELTQLKEIDDKIGTEAAVIKQKLDQAAPTSPEFKKLQVLLQKATAKLAEVQAETEKRKAQLAELAKKIGELGGGNAAPACDAQLPGWDALFAPSGLLNARAQPPDPTKDPCLTPPGAGYRRLENQLYRVEIHQGGPRGQATFKWSRDNGSVVTTIESIKGSVITVHDVGPDDALGFAHGQWVEITDDVLELNGQFGQLAQIDKVDTATREITLLNVAPQPLAATPTGVNAARHPKLRRWDQADQTGAQATAQGVPTTGQWLPLEDGVSVQFSQSGQYRTGDYWLIPARTATGELEWPPYEVPNLNPQPQPRQGIEHHYCRLALIRVQDGVIDKDVTDCRKIFPPLTELTAAATKPALHVVKTNWENDSLFDAKTFQDVGLRITLDGPPDPTSIGNETVIVTIELPYTSGDQANPLFRQPVVVLGQVGVDPADPNTIVWRYVEQPTVGGIVAGPGLIGPIVRPRIPTAAAPAGSVLLRVTLKGHVIWSQAGKPPRFLDGQAFGRPVVNADNQAHTALIFPSGDSARASDFESWFYIGGRQQRAPLQVQSITFKRVVTGAGEQISSAGVITFPRDPAQPVRFKAGELMNMIEVVFNREVQPEGRFDTGAPQGLLFELVSPDGSLLRRVGELEVKSNLARLTARDPKRWDQPGDYRLTVFGDDAQTGPAFVAADDGSALDGNFDSQAGGNLVLLVKAL